MKKHFPGYFPPNDSEIKSLWDTCIFVVDANILLNMYRYSDATRQEFLRVLESIKARLWLPHRAAEEYFENRLFVIAQQEKAYDETVKTIQNLQNDLKNSRQHPFISDKLLKRLDGIFDDVAKELIKNKEVHSKRTTSDKIQDALKVLFQGNVGEPYPEEDLTSICQEGENRYAKKIPPGYKDDKKAEGDSIRVNNHRKFGDLIIWRQLIDKAKEAKKGVVFIIDDKKEDWWTIFKGKNIGPRPELIKEFHEKTNKRFYMYQADRFLEFASKHFKQAVKTESVDEIRDLRHRDDMKQREVRSRRERLYKKEMAQKQLEYIRAKIARLEKDSHDLKRLQFQSLEDLSSEDQIEPMNMERRLLILKRSEQLREEMEKVMVQLQSAKLEYVEAQHMYFEQKERPRTNR